jgi:MFS family permease
VAFVQTAGSLPVMLFAVAAGALGDLVDRRRFLLVAQSVMLAAAVALGALALAGLVTPWTLLALIFALAGLGEPEPGAGDRPGHRRPGAVPASSQPRCRVSTSGRRSGPAAGTWPAARRSGSSWCARCSPRAAS